MPLPKINSPLFTIEIPSLKREVKFRRFLVSEEKIVLMAAESEDDKDVIDACRQIINNCCQEELDIEALASFDLEYIFLQLRRNSVNSMAKVAYKDNEDEKVYEFDVDLSEIEVERTEGHSNKIEITDDITLMLKYPTMSVAETMLEAESPLAMIDNMIVRCVDKIYDADTVYEDYTEEELLVWLNALDSAAYDRIKTFFETMPKISHTIEYTNSKGTERKIQLSGLRDFFIFS